MKALAQWAAAGLAALSLAGCAASIGAAQPSLTAIQTLRQENLPPLKVGDFGLGPAVTPSMDKSITIRAINTISAPGGSFAGYLKSTLEADLRGGGKLDPNAPLVLEGLLTRSDLSSAVGTGTAALGAKFTLRKDGKSVFEKELTVNAEWPSSFIGAVAIPDAINQYTSLYEKMAQTLLTDQDFRAAAGAH